MPEATTGPPRPTARQARADEVRTQLIKDGEQAVDEYNRSQQRSRDQIMPMALGLLAARRKYPANEDFGDWLQTSSYREIEKDERAALIKLGEHEVFASKFIRATKYTTPRTIWDAVRGLLPSSQAAKTTADVLQFPTSPPASADTPKSDEQPPESSTVAIPPPAKMSAGLGFTDAPRAAELHALFQGKKSRTTLSHLWKGRGSKQVWELIIVALDAGLIIANDREFNKPTLSLLFPLGSSSFTGQYHLDNQKHRTHIRDVLLPRMIACKDQLLAQPDRVREILNAHEAAEQAKIRAEADDKRRQQAVATLAPSQQEVIAFGITVWPRLDEKQGPYDYDQIRTAVWTFQDLLAWNKTTNDSSPGSIGIRVRLSMKWYNEYLIRTDPRRENPLRRIFTLLYWISKLYENAPGAECKWPYRPNIEAEW